MAPTVKIRMAPTTPKFDSPRHGLAGTRSPATPSPGVSEPAEMSLPHKHLYLGSQVVDVWVPPWDSPRTLGIGLRQGPRGLHFLVSEVPLYMHGTCGVHTGPDTRHGS